MKTLTQRRHISELTSPGDFCFVADKGADRVVLACPFCGTVAFCPHEIVQRSPLSLSPSVVGPEKCEHPCGHHFIVKDGEAT